MIHAEPLPGWEGHFFHAENLTIARSVVAAVRRHLPGRDH
jgi:hypothetical protein